MKDKDFVIRELMLEDVPEIVSIYHKIKKEEKLISQESLEEQIEFGQSICSLGAVINDKVVGFVIGRILNDMFGQEESTGWIHMLGVDPDFRGKGIGKALGKELIYLFQGLGIKNIKTMVRHDELFLRAYFENIGMKEVEWTVLEYNF